MKNLLIVTIFLLAYLQAYEQPAALPAAEWIKKFSDPNDKRNSAFESFYGGVIGVVDSNRLNTIIRELEEKGNSKDLYFITRLQLAKALALSHKDYLRSATGYRQASLQHVKLALQLANEANDDYLLAYVSWTYFSVAFFYNEIELSVMYVIYSIELYEKLFGNTAFPAYHVAAELMYRVKEYERCRDYGFKWLAATAHTNDQGLKEYRMNVYNTIGLAYYSTRDFDSAMRYYQKALSEAGTYNRRDWKGIVSGNMGQVYLQQKKYDMATALLDTDYHISTQYQYVDNALNALQLMARANAANGNPSLAMQQLKASMQLLPKVPDDGYKQNVYYAAMEVYRMNGLFDSAMHYSRLYQQLHDSIEKRINTSSLSISNVRLTEQRNIDNIRKLQQNKAIEIQRRNFIIACVVLLAIISILVINRQRIRLKYQQASLEKEKEIIATEMAAARRQMEMFTQNIIEKTNLIESLEQQIKENQASAGQQDTLTALTNLTILTEADWMRFKELFEKLHPQYFERLKTKAPDITLAEQRLAALTRLKLTNRQMASMLGISPDSVHKTRQRLRQRMGLSNDINLEEFFMNV